MIVAITWQRPQQREHSEILDEIRPQAGGESYRAQIAHVVDRPGHDRRYAVD